MLLGEADAASLRGPMLGICGLDQQSLTFLVPGTSFLEDNFSMDWGQWRGGGFEMIQVHYIYCALYFYYISSTSDHQALDPGGWGPLV